MQKEEMPLFFFFLHVFRLGYNTSKTAANINRVWDEGSTYDEVWVLVLKIKVVEDALLQFTIHT